MYDNAPSMENFLNSFSGSKLLSGYALFSSVARSMRVHSKKPMGELNHQCMEKSPAKSPLFLFCNVFWRVTGFLVIFEEFIGKSFF